MDRILLSMIKNGYDEILFRDIEINQNVKELVIDLKVDEINKIINLDNDFSLQDVKIKIKLRRDEKE